jgi:hypothetical protein
MIFDPEHLGTAILAIGALGTAAVGVVDACKTLPGGGISHVGFPDIERAVCPFVGGTSRRGATGGVRRMYDTLHGNWINGTPLADQKAIAKSLIKVLLTKDNAAEFAKTVDANVNSDRLRATAEKMSNGVSLDVEETNALGRFDLALTSLLDAAYQHADQRYRNAAKLAASCVSVLLAVVGGSAVSSAAAAKFFDFNNADLWQWVIAGLLATPLAPMAKDLASALQAGVKVAQSLRK